MLEAADSVLREYLDSVLDVVGRYLEGSAPMKLWLFKLFFRKQLKELSGYRDYYLARQSRPLQAARQVHAHALQGRRSFHI